MKTNDSDEKNKYPFTSYKSSFDEKVEDTFLLILFWLTIIVISPFLYIKDKITFLLIKLGIVSKKPRKIPKWLK